MDKPQVDRSSGIPPAIAIDQTNPVRTSRSTVGTMTELNDHLKLLFARAAALYCRAAASRCGATPPRASTQDLAAARRGGGRSAPAAHLPGAGAGQLHATRRCASCSTAGLHALLEPRRTCTADARRRRPTPRREAGRRTAASAGTLQVVQDRLRAGGAERGRVLESLEAALRVGRGRVDVHAVDEAIRRSRSPPGAFRASCTVPGLRPRTTRSPTPEHVLASTRRSAPARPAAASAARIGIDYGLVIPDETRSLRGGAIKPWQTKSYEECQQDLDEVRPQAARHPARYAVARADRRAAPLGDRGRGRLDARRSGTA